MQRLAQLGRSLVELFPERHLYVRSGGAMRAFVLTTRKQLFIASGVAAGALWVGVCTAAMLVNLLSASGADREIAKLKAQLKAELDPRGILNPGRFLGGI